MAEESGREKTLFGGIAGITLGDQDTELGEGITLRSTYVHVMAPYLAAFHRAPAGEHHPAPWKTVAGGLGFDVEVELEVPPSIEEQGWFDQLNTAWWLMALIRLRGCHDARLPVVSDAPFSEFRKEGASGSFHSIEMNPHQLSPTGRAATELSRDDAEWLAQHWRTGGRLLLSNENLFVAVEALDQSRWSRSVPMALLTLWGGLERLFSPGRNELRHRIAENLAVFLCDPGSDRVDLYRRAKRLYDERSAAAHGSSTDNPQALGDTYALLASSVVRMIETGHVPEPGDLTKRLLSGSAGAV